MEVKGGVATVNGAAGTGTVVPASLDDGSVSSTLRVWGLADDAAFVVGATTVSVVAAAGFTTFSDTSFAGSIPFATVNMLAMAAATSGVLLFPGTEEGFFVFSAIFWLKGMRRLLKQA